MAKLYTPVLSASHAHAHTPSHTHTPRTLHSAHTGPTTDRCSLAHINIPTQLLGCKKKELSRKFINLVVILENLKAEN